MPHRFLPILLLCVLPLSAPAQPSYPVIGKAEQKARDEDRRTILQDELDAERAALAKAQVLLAASPSEDREADVHRHLENIQALQRELDASTGKPWRAPVRAVLKVSRPTSDTASARSVARYWDPYNRAPEPTDFSTAPKE